MNFARLCFNVLVSRSFGALVSQCVYCNSRRQSSLSELGGNWVGRSNLLKGMVSCSELEKNDRGPPENCMNDTSEPRIPSRSRQHIPIPQYQCLVHLKKHVRALLPCCPAARRKIRIRIPTGRIPSYFRNFGCVKQRLFR